MNCYLPTLAKSQVIVADRTIARNRRASEVLLRLPESSADQA
jgi:hypothetical protein